MRKRTYSKKPAANSSLLAQCFAASSSPVKPDLLQCSLTPVNISSGYNETDLANTGIPPDSPARNTRSQQKKREAASYANENADESIGGLVEEMGALALMKTEESSVIEKNHAQGAKTEECIPSKNILRSRDANAAAIRPPKERIKHKRLPRDAPSIEDILSKFDNLDISIDQIPPTAEDKTPASADSKTSRPTLSKRSLRANLQQKPRQDFSSYAKPLLSLCNDPSGRQSPTPFQIWADDLSKFFRITKIAEASYGEVYRLSLSSPQQGLGKSDESVLKLIALKPPPEPRTDSGTKSTADARAKARETKKTLAMSSVADVTSEVRLLRHLSPVPGFTNFREIRVLQGRLPRQFVAAWKLYNKTVKKSLFADPSRKASYGEDQLWAVVEMQDAGTDVETLIENGEPEQRISVWAAWDVFWSVACAVAKGEEWTGFEHRDLHMGNICVRSERSNSGCILNPDVDSLDLSRTIGFTGLETTLIDYTLSRADMGSGKNDVAFFDLSKDPAIFQGDGNDDYQYDIYRAMRSAVLHYSPVAKVGTKDDEGSNEGAWRQRQPMTNLIWLHFVLYKLMENLPARSQDLEGQHFALERRLRRRLEGLGAALKLESLADSDLKGAADLIGWAVEEAWLTEEDVVGLNGGNDQEELGG